MKILQVIHGYPLRYNAGSEVYTQGLAQALAERHEVHVFTRQENAFLPEYSMIEETDPSDPRIRLHVINMARARDGYSHAAGDGAFSDLLDRLRPRVVHIGHLNHLSTSLVFPAKERNIPILFTLHDYWLMCPRGQFIQMHPQDISDNWHLCGGQDDTGTWDTSRMRFIRSKPFTPSRIKSSGMNWDGSVSGSSSALSRLPVTLTEYPASDRTLRTYLSILGSSSTARMHAGSPDLAIGGADLWSDAQVPASTDRGRVKVKRAPRPEFRPAEATTLGKSEMPPGTAAVQAKDECYLGSQYTDVQPAFGRDSQTDDQACQDPRHGCSRDDERVRDAQTETHPPELGPVGAGCPTPRCLSSGAS